MMKKKTSKRGTLMMDSLGSCDYASGLVNLDYDLAVVNSSIVYATWAGNRLDGYNKTLKKAKYMML